MHGLHGNNQTINNLEFTLKNEYNFFQTDKIYILNRIVDISKKNKIIKLLELYNTKYIDIPFDIIIFKKIPKLELTVDDIKKLELSHDWKHKGTNEEVSKVIKGMSDYNLYLINNNKSRNFAINYGKKNGYKWTFVLDYNNYILKDCFENIINNLDDKTEYIILSQKRLNDKNLKNNVLLNNGYSITIQLRNHEPQLAFKNTSTIFFNPNIPYGLSPKAELINSFCIKGPWNNWMTFFGLNIKPRKFLNVNYQILSFVIRLDANNKSNNIRNNFMNRWMGLYNLVKKINDQI